MFGVTQVHPSNGMPNNRRPSHWAEQARESSAAWPVDGSKLIVANPQSSQLPKKPTPLCTCETSYASAVTPVKRSSQHPTAVSQPPQRGSTAPPTIRGSSQTTDFNTSCVSPAKSKASDA